MDMKLDFSGEASRLGETKATCYRQTVRSLQYIIVTWPNVAFAVNKMSQYMVNPMKMHWSALQRILRYLSLNPFVGLHIKAMLLAWMEAYSDADWAGDSVDRWSHRGCFMFWGGNLISWCSRKQPTVVRWSTEVECWSLVDAASELNWMETVFMELGAIITA